ncbi:MAG: response regulator [Myxococcota bacterium]
MKTNNTITILVVDDDPMQRDVVRRLLEADGYTVKTASSAAQALACSWTPDVLLSDVQMPGMDGFALARAFHGRCPVVLMSGKFFTNRPGRLSKPFSGAQLRAAIQDALRSPKSAAA